MGVKGVVWVGASRKEIRGMPEMARQRMGRALRVVQEGGTPPDWKWMRSVGDGVIEIRVEAAGAFRLMYVARLLNAVYVLHVFEKKSRKTPKLNITVARARLASVRRQSQE